MATEPSEEQIRAYEEELSRLNSIEIVIQAVASLISIGGRRLGLAGGGEAERDLEQVRDAIDGARALMPILDRRMPPAQVNQLKSALSQLQMGYAQLAQASGTAAGAGSASAATGPDDVGGAGGASGEDAGAADAGSRAGAGGPGAPGGGAGGGQGSARGAGSGGEAGNDEDEQPAPKGPGPAESSGRLWVPGR